MAHDMTKRAIKRKSPEIWPRRNAVGLSRIMFREALAASSPPKPQRQKSLVGVSLALAFAKLAEFVRQFGIWDAGAPAPGTQQPSWIEVEPGFVRLHQRGPRDRVEKSAEILALVLNALGFAVRIRDVTHCVNMRGFRASLVLGGPALTLGVAR